MPKITDEQFEEYKQLKKWAKREKVFKSAKEITKLEDDIDTPIKNCVGMFALLGCQPKYSCCGFDYIGQPFHKSHQYGRPYFILKSNQRTISIIFEMQKRRSVWVASPGSDRHFTYLEIVAEMNPHWRQHECIHFSEECVIGIEWLERFLWSAKGYMKDSVVLKDTNAEIKEYNKNWQYPPKEPWFIRLKDIEDYLTKK